jgi:hypothetical protein
MVGAGQGFARMSCRAVILIVLRSHAPDSRVKILPRQRRIEDDYPQKTIKRDLYSYNWTAFTLELTIFVFGSNDS